MAETASGELMTVVLDDFRCVVVRVIGPEDAPRLQRLHARLSERTNRLRFFSYIPVLSEKQAAYFAGVDHHDREAVVAEADGEIVAVVRYDRLPREDAAEIAMLVRDDYQHHRLGPILLTQLVHIAALNGIRRVIAETLPENTDVLPALRTAGLRCAVCDHDGTRFITGEIVDPWGVTP